MQEQYIPDINNEQDRKYIQLTAEISEIDRIFKQIDFLLRSTRTKANAARVISEQCGPDMMEALDLSKEALIQWLGSLQAIRER